MREESNNNTEKSFAAVVGLIVWRWGTGIAVLVAAYGTMWVKTNAPSRLQFEALTIQVQGLREEMIRYSNHNERVLELKLRQDRIEERVLELERKSTPRRTQP